MKRTLLTLLLSCSFYIMQAQTTVVYIVRHAEKELTDSRDPTLTPQGLQRAHEIDQLLQKEQVVATFSTNYKRTRQTVQPVAQRIGAETILYDAIDNLVKRVLSEYKGGTVLIAGHSNTVLTIVKAFGGTPSITEIKDHEYGYLFKLEITDNNVHTSQLHVGL